MEFHPIVLRYEGLETDQHMIDLSQVGSSIHGAAQLLGSAGTIVLTGQYAKHIQTLPVRVFAGTPNRGTWELPALIMSAAPVLVVAAPLFPAMAEVTKTAATKAVTSIVNYVVSRLGGQTSDTKVALGTVEKALAEVGQTSRHAIDAVERIALNQRPSVRLLVVPVGDSCTSLRIGEIEHGAVEIDKPMRDAIDAPDPIVIGPAGKYEILLSELDLKNRSCKFSFRTQDDPEHRTNGEITDPILNAPFNPYSAAFNSQQWLTVVAKPELKEGDIEKLYISDIGYPPVGEPILASA